MPKINKSAVETAKTVLIAVLITAVVAFIGGMQYAAKQQATVDHAVKSAVTAHTQTATTAVKK